MYRRVPPPSSPPSPPPPPQLLEITLISAQDLTRMSRSMQTYAAVWMNPKRRLTTRVDESGCTQPTWNDKFVFRVDEQFLSADTSSVMIEIYAVSWLRDICLGAVRVMLSSLVPPSPGDALSSTRFVALQVRRPSGRPKGILNVGVTLLDGAMRSMPLYTELSASAVGLNDLLDGRAQRGERRGQEEEEDEFKKVKVAQLRRTQSELTDYSTTNTKLKSIHNNNAYAGSESTYNGSICGSSAAAAATAVVATTEVNGSLCSDLGPSASVVAAAVERGLYRPPPATTTTEGGSSILEGWTEESCSSGVEGLRTKLERWRAELPPVFDREYNNYRKGRPERPRRRRHSDGGAKLFSCFANSYGCEFTIKCGGTRKGRKSGGGKAPVSPLNDDEGDDDDDPFVVVHKEHNKHRHARRR